MNTICAAGTLGRLYIHHTLSTMTSFNGGMNIGMRDWMAYRRRDGKLDLSKVRALPLVRNKTSGMSIKVLETTYPRTLKPCQNSILIEKVSHLKLNI